MNLRIWAERKWIQKCLKSYEQAFVVKNHEITNYSVFFEKRKLLIRSFTITTLQNLYDILHSAILHLALETLKTIRKQSSVEGC